MYLLSPACFSFLLSQIPWAIFPQVTGPQCPPLFMPDIPFSISSQHWWRPTMGRSSHAHYLIFTVPHISILRRKQKPRECGGKAQGHADRKWQGWNWNPGLLTLGPEVLLPLPSESPLVIFSVLCGHSTHFCHFVPGSRDFLSPQSRGPYDVLGSEIPFFLTATFPTSQPMPLYLHERLPTSLLLIPHRAPGFSFSSASQAHKIDLCNLWTGAFSISQPCDSGLADPKY